MKQRKFAVGDKVRCIDGSPHGDIGSDPKRTTGSGIHYGKVYTVTKATETEIKINDIYGLWKFKRFEPTSNSNKRLLLTGGAMKKNP